MYSAYFYLQILRFHLPILPYLFLERASGEDRKSPECAFSLNNLNLFIEAISAIAVICLFLIFALLFFPSQTINFNSWAIGGAIVSSLFAFALLLSLIARIRKYCLLLLINFPRFLQALQYCRL